MRRTRQARPAAGAPGAGAPEGRNPVLRTRGVVKHIGSGRARQLILDGVDLEVGRGEMVAVLGRSGSGKSTLLHLLGGLDQPDAGRISVAGTELSRASQRALDRVRLRRIGFIFQSFQLIEELTGAENVMLAARLPGAPAGGTARASSLIERLGVAAVAGHRPHELSGGEQQRFAIARALVNDPALVLADEATGNLDSGSGATVLGILGELAAEGRAVVLVTHEPQSAAAANRVLHLAGGRLQADPEPSIPAP
ncbi:MAG: ABC transporter ATP-binding protein [Solirubrobacterales bacterium]|nr:ABC transporter ATP-binding protein [Solirubrobacterales bacterium]